MTRNVQAMFLRQKVKKLRRFLPMWRTSSYPAYDQEVLGSSLTVHATTHKNLQTLSEKENVKKYADAQLSKIR